MTLSFMIKKKYLIEKVAEQEETGTFHERRAYKPFWRTRIGSIHRWKNGGEAVFLCGRYAFAADIIEVTMNRHTYEIDGVGYYKLCYAIECKFLQEELEALSMFLS